MLNAIFLLWQHFTGELLEAIPSVKTEIGRCTRWNIRIIPTSALTSTPATITSAPLQSPILMATPQAFAWQLGDIQCLWSSLFSKPSAPSWPQFLPDLVDTWATLIKHSCTLSLSHHAHSLCPQPVPTACLLQGCTSGADCSSYKNGISMPMDVITFSWPPTHIVPLTWKQSAHLPLLYFLSFVQQENTRI